jgi:hypothetical protein
MRMDSEVPVVLPIERIEAILLMSRERMVLSSSSGQFTAPDTLVPFSGEKDADFIPKKHWRILDLSNRRISPQTIHNLLSPFIVK